MREVIWSHSSARTNRACCVSTSLSARPGAHWGWASARAVKTPMFFTALAAASEGRIVTNPGGVLIRDTAGDVIGAVGISGDTSDRDEACAIAGIEAAGLKADPGQDVT